MTGSATRHSTFGVSGEELQTLLTNSGKDLIEKVEQEHGGVEGLCQKLETSQNGLPVVTPEEFRRRQEVG